MFLVHSTNVDIFVSTGKYEFDLEIFLPSSCQFDVGKISLWVDGRIKQESEKINITALESFMFEKVTTKEKTYIADVMLTKDGQNYIKYATVTVDSTTGKIISESYEDVSQ